MIKKSKLFFAITVILSFLISYFVANKPNNLDRDYYVYYNAFIYGEDKEFIFNFIRDICHYFDADIFYLFFFYCFFSLVFKFKIISDLFYDKSFISIILFVILYFICFFPLWEVTQIRGSLAVSLFIYAMTVDDFRKKTFWIFLSILVHNSIFMLAGLYFIIDLLYKRKVLFLFLCGFFVFISSKIIGYTYYDVYSLDNRLENYKTFSLKNFYIFTTISLVLYIQHIESYRNQFIVKGSFLVLFMLVFCIITGYGYPSVATRYSDIILFITLILLFSLNDRKNIIIYKFFSVFLLVYYFFGVFFGSEDPIFDYSLFMSIFLL